MQPKSSFIVSESSSFQRTESSNVGQLTFISYTYPVFPLVLADTLIARQVTSLYSAILSILNTIAFSKIKAAIIERVTIPMVSFLFVLTIKYGAMHKDCSFASLIVMPYCVIGLTAPQSSPVPLIEPIKIRGIYGRILFPRQWDKAVGLVKRLNNRVSLHAAFHRSSSQGLLKFSRIIAQVDYARS